MAQGMNKAEAHIDALREQAHTVEVEARKLQGMLTRLQEELWREWPDEEAEVPVEVAEIKQQSDELDARAAAMERLNAAGVDMGR